MAYVPSTNPPQIIIPALGTKGPNFWTYESADDAATVNTGNYFSNGLELGMKVGDYVYVYDTGTPLGSLHFVASFTASAAAVDFAAIA